MPPAQMHRCTAPECSEQVAERLLMCPKHWRMVPEQLQSNVWKTYRLRSRGGRYEADHYNACKAAIESVRKQLDDRKVRSAQTELL